MRIDRALILILGAWLPAMACAAGAETTDDTLDDALGAASDDQTADAGGDKDVEPTFANVYARIELQCGGGKSGCHVAGASGGLELHDADAAYARLVDVASTKCPDEMRVVSGDADASQLVQVLEGTSACVKPMPLGRDPMSTVDIALVRAWIEAGAPAD